MMSGIWRSRRRHRWHKYRLWRAVDQDGYVLDHSFPFSQRHIPILGAVIQAFMGCGRLRRIAVTSSWNSSSAFHLGSTN
jgi:hypothetical protein|nr:hypothetical protein [Chelativorans oligotrophicus]